MANDNGPTYVLKVWGANRFQLTMERSTSPYLDENNWFTSIDKVGQHLSGIGVDVLYVERQLPRHLKDKLDRYGIEQRTPAS